jgi:hypothetical protein
VKQPTLNEKLEQHWEQRQRWRREDQRPGYGLAMMEGHRPADEADWRFLNPTAIGDLCHMFFAGVPLPSFAIHRSDEEGMASAHRRLALVEGQTYFGGQKIDLFSGVSGERQAGRIKGQEGATKVVRTESGWEKAE